MKLAKFYAHESCGKCVPCREGTNWTVKMLERIQSGEATPMDLDIMASVQEQIIGNCLCVLGDAMAMPIGSMVEKFRGELEDEIEAARERAESGRAARRRRARRGRRARRPDPRSLEPYCRHATPRAEDHPADDRRPRGRRPSRARCSSTPPSHGDVEIPYFCYEPKLGNPVGACRMCLVEIEGIPKLQTSCSTPVKDGMVVHTQTDRVRHAQNAVVEFLLVNHPLDCPVCDKGGECPLQDITFGWGLGRSRFIEPKRHFEKPLALSPLVAIDRERCILCYRCVRFSQEIAEDYQLIFAERGAHTFVGTHDGHPYVAPFSGNIIELCPVGALTSQPYRFRARPWDIEDAGGICTLCPSQCNVDLHGPRRAGPARARPRPRHRGRRRLAVRQGPLRLPGDPRRRADHRSRSSATAASCARSPGSARSTSPPAWHAQGPRRRARRRPGDQRGGLPAPAPEPRGARLRRHRLARRRAAIPASWRAGSRRPRCRRTVPDLEFAHTVLVVGCEPLDDAPILDLRIRKGVRRHGVQLGDRERAAERARPQRRDSSCATRPAPRPRSSRRSTRRSPATSRSAGDHAQLAELLRDGGEDVVIVWGERIGARRAPVAARHRRRASASPAATAPACSRSRPAPTAAGCARPACCRTRAPATPPLDTPGRGAAEIAQAAADGEITALHLFQTDPLRDLPDRALWEAALHRAGARGRARVDPHRGPQASTPT